MTSRQRYRGLRRTSNREALMVAAEELFGARKFSSVAVDDIVTRAGVAKGTFYNHFASKEDIGLQLALAIRHEVRDRIAELKVVSPDSAVHLAIAVTLFLDLARKRPNRARILAGMLSQASNAGAEANERVRKTLEAGLANGRFQFGSVDAALISVIGIVFAGIHNLVEHDARVGEERIVALVAHALTCLGLHWDDAENDVARPVVKRVLCD